MFRISAQRNLAKQLTMAGVAGLVMTTSALDSLSRSDYFGRTYAFVANLGGIYLSCQLYDAV